jgi:hypothetical protein
MTTLCIMCHYAGCHYAECRVSYIVMLNAIMLSDIMLRVFMQRVIILDVVAPYKVVKKAVKSHNSFVKIKAFIALMAVNLTKVGYWSSHHLILN